MDIQNLQEAEILLWMCFKNCKEYENFKQAEDCWLKYASTIHNNLFTLDKIFKSLQEKTILENIPLESSKKLNSQNYTKTFTKGINKLTAFVQQSNYYKNDIILYKNHIVPHIKSIRTVFFNFATFFNGIEIIPKPLKKRKTCCCFTYN